MVKQKLSISVSEETMDRIEELVQLLPERIVNGKPQKVTKSSIIELYSSIVHNYFNQTQLPIEYEMLDVTDGRRVD